MTKLERVLRIAQTTAIISLVLTALSTSGLAQKTTPQSVRIDHKHSTVYLTFVRVGRAGSEMEERIWLRFHNNTRWGIRLDMGGEQKDFGDARLFYDILTAYERVDSSVSCHVCSFNILGPGKSLLFSIPRDNIVNFYGIRIQFSY